MRVSRLILKALLRLALAGAAALALLLGVLWLDHLRETRLPELRGPFAVGRTSYVWREAIDRSDGSPTSSHPRELVALVWYPAAQSARLQKRAEYFPAPWRRAIEAQRGLLLTKFLGRDLARVETHSVADAAVSPVDKQYPVVLLRAGLAAQVGGYASLAEDLASRGYIVAGFDAPYRSGVVVFPDGRVIRRSTENDLDQVSGPEAEALAERLVALWSQDMSFALDQVEKLNSSDASGKFRGRIDMTRVGAVGHSLGGATSLAFCHGDVRCKAAADIDGAPVGSVIRDGMTQPVLFLMSDHRGERLEAGEPESIRNAMFNIRSIYNGLPTDRRQWLMIPGANHYQFSDDGAMLKSPVLLLILRRVGVLQIDGRRQIALTTQLVSRFFDQYLQGGSTVAEQHSDPELVALH